jgi:hypothetical protein
MPSATACVSAGAPARLVLAQIEHRDRPPSRQHAEWYRILGDDVPQRLANRQDLVESWRHAKACGAAESDAVETQEVRGLGLA